MGSNLDSRKAARGAARAEAAEAALEAFVLMCENLGPEDIRRINDAAGLAPGQAPPDAHPMEWLPEARAKSARAERALPRGPIMLPAVRENPVPARGVQRIRARGDAMIGVGISDGDQLEVDQDLEPADGDAVLAELADGSRALRTLRIIGGAIVLEPANPNFKPIAVEDPASVKLLGVVRKAPSPDH